MKWLSKLFGGRNADAPEPYVDKLVPDDEYQFQFGTKPMLPEGLRDLKITEIRRGLLILENFEIDLTVDQSYMDTTLEKIAMASRCLRWAKTYHDLDTDPRPPVRLHLGNVLITASHYTDQHEPEDDILAWLGHFEWDAARPFRTQWMVTNRPLEESYFSCVRILADNSDGQDMPTLNWSERDCTESVLGCLSGFVQEELERVRQEGTERFLQQMYGHIPREELTHPVFTLLDFPAFGMGTVKMTFSGSVWSENELRFWSRPTYYHK